MICHGCMQDADDAQFLLAEIMFAFCGKCSVTYAKGRMDWTFSLHEEVMIKEWHRKVENRIFIIKGIYIFEECESGRMIFLVDKETQRPLKTILDTNWLLKL